MSLFEFFILGLYLSFLTSIIVAIQIINPGKAIREAQKGEIDSELEEEMPEDEKPPFNPETEEYTMTENPMLRHRNVEDKQKMPFMEQVD